MRMEKATEILLAWELHEHGLSKSAIGRHLGRHRETIIIWIAGVQEQGIKSFVEASRTACKGSRRGRQVDALVKRWVWEIREREENCCGQKIAYFLEKEHGVKLSVPKSYEVLAEKYVIRSKWKKNKVRGEVPVATAPRQVIEMDTVNFGGLFAFTAVDIWSREADVLLCPALNADVLLCPALNAHNGTAFLHWCMRRRFNRFVEIVQTDGGSEFEAEFALQVSPCRCGTTAGITALRDRIARPYKKNEQAHLPKGHPRVSIARCEKNAWDGTSINRVKPRA